MKNKMTLSEFTDKSLTELLNDWEKTRASLQNDALKLIEKFESSTDFAILDIIDLWSAMSSYFDENGFRNDKNIDKPFE
jgi:hypothetical protein